MDTSPTELVGYVASLFVLVSFLMKDMRTLRMVNSVGCALFVVYGVMLAYSIPIILTNTAILAINGRALLKK
jgi:hypothetical protein